MSDDIPPFFTDFERRHFARSLAIPDGDDAPAVDVHEWPPAATSIVGAMAADAVERAIADALRSATASGGLEPI